MNSMPSLLRPTAFGLMLLLALPALAQDNDQPIPYTDQQSAPSYPPSSGSSSESQPLPYESNPTPMRRQELPVEKEDDEKLLAASDDPATGLGVELMGGLMLVDDSGGPGFYPQLGFGLRATWDYGRLLANSLLHQALFADLIWLHTQRTDGTKAVSSGTAYNGFVIAPAWEFPFADKSPFGVYLQVGAGTSLLSSSFDVNGGSTPVGGLKPLLEYGLGLRGRPLLSQDGKMRLEFRVELLGFRRGYMNDYYLGGSIGIAY